VGPFGPGIFADATTKIAIAVNPDGTWRLPPRHPGPEYSSGKIGDPGGLIIYCTGLGRVDSIPANGAASLDKLPNRHHDSEQC